MTRTSTTAGERLGALSASKKELLQLLREEEFRQSRKIKVHSRGDGSRAVRLPASWAQAGMWFIDQLQGGDAGYHIPMTLRLQGDLDREALQNALNGLVQRHEMLRTVFVSIQGTLQQEIAANGDFALRVIDLRGYEGEREAQISLHRIEEAHKPFNLRSGPLIRGLLLLVGVEEHVLLITMHHIITDGWSTAVMLRDLAEIYRACATGRTNPIEPLKIQYADYAQWQRQWLQGEVLAKQLSYWRTRLDGAPPQMELPTNQPRPVVQSYRGENIKFALDAELSATLKAFAHQHEMTLFMVLCAGWAILLSLLSGQEDVVIGTPVANRQRPELEALIGPFVNTLVLRIAVRRDRSVVELLKDVKEVALGAYDHQDVAFEQVVEALRPQRDLSRHPLFQVMLALQNAPKAELRLPGLIVTTENDLYGSSKFDLTLSLEEQGQEIAGTVNYATDLFDQETVGQWMRCFTVLLRAITDDARARVGDLPILPEDERVRLIESFNATRRTCPEKLIHELFEEQVRRAPDAIAVVHERQSLTYAELNSRANQLAWYLRRRGVGPDRLVALCVERRPEMLVGLLGVLKAGGAYLPLDPTNPAARLAHILSDAQPHVVLTTEAVKSTLPQLAAETILLDGDWKEIGKQREQDLDPRSLQLRPEHLAYVIYTSGSTGSPKGVMIEHRNIVNYTLHVIRQLDVASGAGSLICTSISFDLMLTGLYATLLCGRTVRLCPEQHGVPTLLDEILRSRNLAPVKLTPSHLALLEHALRCGQLAGRVRVLVLGGEQLQASAVQLWKKHSPHTRVFNHYGPTEATVGCIVNEIEELPDSGAVPIGRPISNTQIYILGDGLQPVPVGVLGEIYIGGAGVARGYLNRPALTAERFIADPFSRTAGARMYKSGDLGRWRADGSIEYLGRNDDQVKIRGYRVELGEIEAQLRQHEQVKEAAIIAREDASGEKHLVAYVTPRHRDGADVEKLRAQLRDILPAYMVPSAFVVLESLPLTSNGKLNRRALPAPQLGAEASKEYEAPQGEIEEVVAGIWRALLGIERVGRRDDFFELGGHSLLAVRVTAHIRDALDVELPLSILFERPTVEALSDSIVERIAAELSMEAP